MNTNHTYFDGESLLDVVISIPPERMQRAAQLCQSITDADLQWQTYLDAIALFGVEGWLHDQTPALSLSTQHSPVFHLSGDVSHRMVNRLDAGDFQLCILSTGTLTDTVVPVPSAAVDDALYIPHFYVLTEVEEEYDQVRIAGFLRADQIAQNQIAPAVDSIYSFALDWFEPHPENLLLYLRCLEPGAIARPVASPAPPIVSNVVEHAINVASWLRGHLDAAAEAVSWVLLPPPSVGQVMLSAQAPVEQYDGMLNELIAQGVDIPRHARSAFRNLSLGRVNLRLYAVTWDLHTNGAAEWALVVILGSLDAGLPADVRLVVRDDEHLLVDQTVTGSSRNSYLFAQVIGEQHERFWVTVDMSNGARITLPFSFSLDTL